jgi:hypothetical protein
MTLVGNLTACDVTTWLYHIFIEDSAQDGALLDEADLPIIIITITPYHDSCDADHSRHSWSHKAAA